MIWDSIKSGDDGLPLFIQSVTRRNSRILVTFFNGLTIDMPPHSYRVFYSTDASDVMRGEAVKWWRVGSFFMGNCNASTVKLESIIDIMRDSHQPPAPAPITRKSPYRYC